MVSATQAAAFWGAVEDCLVSFHNLQREAAAGKVTSLWRRLREPDGYQGATSYADMIYHEEPWYIACNLAGSDVSIQEHQSSYEKILKCNHLA